MTTIRSLTGDGSPPVQGSYPQAVEVTGATRWLYLSGQIPVAPDGSLYNISNRAGGSADNLVGTYTFNLSTEALNGTWRLRVNDNAGGDVGYINSWSITF